MTAQGVDVAAIRAALDAVSGDACPFVLHSQTWCKRCIAKRSIAANAPTWLGQLLAALSVEQERSRELVEVIQEFELAAAAFARRDSGSAERLINAQHRHHLAALADTAAPQEGA